MKKTLAVIVVCGILTVAGFSPAFAETSETVLRPGEWKCDWSAQEHYGTAWITIKSVENEVVKGEVHVTGSTLVGYEKFTGVLIGDVLTAQLARVSMSLMIEKGEIIGGVGYGTRDNGISSCFKMK